MSWLSAKSITITAVAAVFAVAIAVALDLRPWETPDAISLVVLAGGDADCLMSKTVGNRESGLADLGLDIAKSLVHSGLAVTGDYLEEKANETSSDLESAARPAYLLDDLSASNGKIPTGITCLVIAHGILGEFDPDHPPPNLSDSARKTRYDPEGLFAKTGSDGKSFSVIRALHLTDYPLSYFEFRLTPDNTSSFFRYVPEAIYFRQSIASVHPKARKKIEITITASLPTSTGSLTSTDNSDPIVFQTPIIINDIYAGSVLGVVDQNGTNAISEQYKWFSLSNMPSAEDVIAAKTQAKNKPAAARHFSPVNLSISYREREGTDLLLRYLGVALKKAGG